MVRYPGGVEARSVAGNQQQDLENAPGLQPDDPGACLWPVQNRGPSSAAMG